MNPCMTVAEMRSLSGLPYATDAEATVAIIAAQQVAEGYLNRALVRDDQDETFDLQGRRMVLLHAYPSIRWFPSHWTAGAGRLRIVRLSGILVLPRDMPPASGSACSTSAASLWTPCRRRSRWRAR
jgi:hypothetical protein